MKNKQMVYLFFTIGIAAILWYLTFIVKPLNFWLEMSLSIVALGVLAYILDKDVLNVGKVSLRHLGIGILSAVGLYLIFYFGNIISGYLFPFKDSQISLIYGNKAQGSLVLIGILLFCIIGPGEEIYWRGFVQKTLEKKFGENKGYIFAALLYAFVHIVTWNFMIVLASLVCGLYWGWLYKKEKSLLPVIISHALWDVTIFVLLPVM